MPPGSSAVRVQLAPVRVRVGGLAPLLSTYPWEVQECESPRSDEVYRGQIESMGKEMERLHSDNVILRKSQEESVMLIKSLKAVRGRCHPA